MRSEALEKALAPYAVFKGDKQLRAGLMMGAIVAVATLMVATLLFSGERLEVASVQTPVGAVLPVPTESLELVTEDDVISVAVAAQKNTGDDPDVTGGLLFYAHVSVEESARTESSEEAEIPVACCAGTGVGIVTKPGLDQPVGEAVIDRVPRSMITAAVRSVYRGGSFKSFPDTTHIVVTLSCPEGEKKAKKTLNPKLDIQGGPSILGTEGIVQPISWRALIETIVADAKFHLIARSYFLVVSRSYRLHFLEGHFGVGAVDPVVISNFIGEMFGTAVQYGAKGALFVDHIGKFVKLAGGTMNTHSREMDCHLELLVIHASRVGAPKELVTAILQTGLMTEAMRLLKESGFLEVTSENLFAAMERVVAVRTRGETEVGILFYILEDGILMESENVRRLTERSTET